MILSQKVHYCDLVIIETILTYRESPFWFFEQEELNENIKETSMWTSTPNNAILSVKLR